MTARRRRRTVLVALGLTLLGCTPDAVAPATPGATAACGAVDFPPLQFGSHLLGDNEPPVPYSSSPPTSGWHAAGAVPQGVFDSALPETAQVSVLEAGGVVVTHHDLAPVDLARLRTRIEERFADRVVLTPYDGIPAGASAFTSWGALQVCDGVDLEALDAYANAYAATIATHD